MQHMRHGADPVRLSTRPQLASCPRCGAAILRAMTAPPMAWEVRADPVPLDLAAEILALLAGRYTYDLATFAMRPELIWRDPCRILRRDWPVLATHRCPGPVPYFAIPPIADNKETDNDVCPF